MVVTTTATSRPTDTFLAISQPTRQTPRSARPGYSAVRPGTRQGPTPRKSSLDRRQHAIKPPALNAIIRTTRRPAHSLGETARATDADIPNHTNAARANIPSSHSMVSGEFCAPIELHGDSLKRRARRFLEPSPFLRLCEPVVHFLFRKRSPLTAHRFKRCEPARRIHLRSLVRLARSPTYHLVT